MSLRVPYGVRLALCRVEEPWRTGRTISVDWTVHSVKLLYLPQWANPAEIELGVISISQSKKHDNEGEDEGFGEVKSPYRSIQLPKQSERPGK